VEYAVEQTDTNVLSVKMPNVKAGWSQKFLLRSDAHHDNIHCRQDLEKQHLIDAKKYGAGILDTGDLHCCMQGKYDKRSDKSQCRPENQCTNYLDSIVDSAAKFYAPYAQNFINFGMGNHESAILNRHETNLSERLANQLNSQTGSDIKVLGYTGWIRFQFIIQKTRYYKQVLWYTHGYGGGGPVTQDLIQSNRQLVYIENADIMMSGHVHRSWLVEFVRHRVADSGRVERREGWYVKLPTYKDSYGKGVGGFEVEKGHGPRPLGAWWLEFSFERNAIKTRIYKA
jgi:hypothetical protein